MFKFSTFFPQYKLLILKDLKRKQYKNTLFMTINGGKNGNNSK